MPKISEFQNLEGAMSEIDYDERPSITGSITYEGAIVIGYIEIGGEIVTGEIMMPEREAAEIYRGETFIIPSTEHNIVLETAYKQVLDDITVKKIFYAEVTNTSGGYTVTIGE